MSFLNILNRIDQLIIRERIIGYSRIFIFILIAIVTFEENVNYFFLSGQDFRSFYGAGQILIEGKYDSLYQLETQKVFQEKLGFTLDKGWPLALYLNPPVFAWIMQPFALLSYSSALFFWRLVSVIVVTLFIAKTIKYLDLKIKWWDALLILMVSLPGFLTIFNGQSTFIFLAIYAASFIMFKQRGDFVGGTILGLGVLKPQLFWFMPIIFLFQKRWQALAGFAATTAFLSFTSIYLVGIDGIASYLSLLKSVEYKWFVNWRVFDMHSLTAFYTLITGKEFNGIVFLISTVLIVFIITTYLKLHNISLDTIEIFSIGIFGSLVASPHLFHYDLSVLFLPYLFMYSWTQDPHINYTIRRNFRLLAVLLFVTLWFNQFLIHYIKVQFSVPIMLFMLFFILQKVREKSKIMSLSEQIL